MFQLYYALFVLALQRGGVYVCLHVVPSNMDDHSLYIVSRRTFGQGGCYIINSSTRKGAYMGSAATVKSTSFYFLKVRVTDKESVHMFSR